MFFFWKQQTVRVGNIQLIKTFSLSSLMISTHEIIWLMETNNQINETQLRKNIILKNSIKYSFEYIWEKLVLRYNCMWKMFVWEFWLWLFITFRREEILSETWFKSLDCADCYTLKANSSFPPWIQSENIFAIRRPSPEKNLFFQPLPKLPAVKRAKPSR